MAVLLTLALTACDFITTDKTQVAETVLTIKNLKKIELPLSSICGTSLEVLDEDSIRRIIPNFPENLKFGGLLKVSENYSAIILLDTYADQQIHYLTTVSKQGKIIEKFNLFSSGCSEDEFSWGQAKYVIDKDLKIVQTDSSATYKRTESGEIINEATISSSHRFEFQVDTDGKIRKYGT